MNTDEQRRREEHEQIREHQRNIVAYKVWRCCLNCDYFITRTRMVNARAVEDQHCSLYRQMPPPAVIVHGCESWTNDIPF